MRTSKRQLNACASGQQVNLVVDMYGPRTLPRPDHGFTMGTGSTLAPASGGERDRNFQKVSVFRYGSSWIITTRRAAALVGLSVTPYVLVDRPMEGSGSGGRFLQPAIGFSGGQVPSRKVGVGRSRGVERSRRVLCFCDP